MDEKDSRAGHGDVPAMPSAPCSLPEFWQEIAELPDGRRVAWIRGSGEAGDNPESPWMPPAVPGAGRDADARGLDHQALFDALADGGYFAGRAEEQDQIAAELAAATPLPADPAQAQAGWQRLAAFGVEHMHPGPALAGWLAVAGAGAGALDEDALAGLASGARRQAAWAQAVQLTATAQIAARAAAADEKIGTRSDGRPARVCADAIGQIALGQTMSAYAAEWWAHLAADLAWRLPAVGAALAAGAIDLDRARLITEATARLTEDGARAVASRILPEAGSLVRGELRDRLRRAVMDADPDGTEQRKKDAEACARVRLYGDEEGTATLAGYNLPAILAAAAMAKITAMARASKAAAGGGALDLHRAQVMLGLILGTLGPIPPAEGVPPDEPPPGDAPGPEPPPPDDAPGPEPPLPDDAPDPEPPLPEDSDGDDWLPGTIIPPWPGLPAAASTPGDVPLAFRRARARRPERPVPGLLDLTVPWRTLAGIATLPGTVGRLGPVTPPASREIAEIAAADSAAAWRIIVTDPDGRAITVTRVPRTGRERRDEGHAPARGAGLVGRVTMTISTGQLALPAPDLPAGPLGRRLAAALRAAARAAAHAAQTAAAAGSCSHARASPCYRAPPRLREYIVARDVTCRSPVCRQPAWQADLDHVIPWDAGGLSCDCNLGSRCRRDHQLKQHPRWTLTEPRPGWFHWTTPAGRTYIQGPDVHPV